MFIGRKSELDFLENRYAQKDGQLVVLYGRRRVGKTETLRQFCKGKPHVFFSCRECSDKMQLKAFSEKLLKENVLASAYINEFADWEKALRSVADLPYGKKRGSWSLMSSLICAMAIPLSPQSCKTSGMSF